MTAQKRPTLSPATCLFVRLRCRRPSCTPDCRTRAGRGRIACGPRRLASSPATRHPASGYMRTSREGESDAGTAQLLGFAPGVQVDHCGSGRTMVHAVRQRYASVHRARAGAARGKVPVMTVPGGEITAGTRGRDRLRASHADRDQVIDALKAGFVQGRLSKDEFDVRIGQALASRTYADLAAVTADIPVVAVEPLRPATPARGTWPPWWYRHRRALGLVACGVIPLVLLIAAFITNNNDFWPPIMAAFFAAILTAGGIAATAPEQKRSVGQPRHRPLPGAGSQISRRPPPAAKAGLPTQIDQAPRRTAEAAPRHVLRPHLPGRRPQTPWLPAVPATCE